MASEAQVFSVGVGGATSSGKTTLSKHLFDLLNPAIAAYRAQQKQHTNLLLVHQDDFVPAEQDLPWNEATNATDWDTPYGSVLYDSLAQAVSHAKSQSELLPGLQSIDALNNLPDVPISQPFR